MESQLHRQHGQHGYEEDPRHAGLHSAVAGEGEGEQHHGEKKSVLKKVKDKAKKIKDTIKKHGHGQEHGHEHGHNSEEEEEEDEDEEVVDDPEVHGAPTTRIANLGQGITPGKTGVRDEGMTRPSAPGGIRDNMGRTTAMETDEAINRPSALVGVQNEAKTRPSVPVGMRNDMGRKTTQTTFGKVDGSPVMGREEANLGQTRVKIEQPVGLEEDPHSPKNIPGAIPPSNYQSKVADPTGTGGKDADVAPLVHQFDKMKVYDHLKSKPESEQRLYRGSHDQFAPQSTPTIAQFTPESNTVKTSTGSENPESTLKGSDLSKTQEIPRDTVTGKLSYATSAIADKAISAKNVVASKLGYGVHEDGRDFQKAASEPKKPMSETASEYAQHVAAAVTEKLAPVYHKVGDASGTVMSKVQGSGVHDEGGDKAAHVGNEGAATKGTDKGVSMKNYLAEKFRPGDEDKALSESISSAFHKKGETGRTGEEKPMGRVTESEQVARRLSTGTENKREGEDAVSAGIESKGTGMVDKIKDAVGSWLGKSEGMQTAKESVAQSHVSDSSSAPTQAQ